MKVSKPSILNLSRISYSKFHSRRGDTDTGDILAILAIVILGGLLIGQASGIFSLTPNKPGSGSAPTTQCGSQGFSSSQQLKFTDAAVQGASALTSPSANLFSSSGVGYTTDNPGSLSSAVTTSGSYSLPSAGIVQYTATGAFPIWATLGTGTSSSQAGLNVLATMGGLNVLTVLNTPGSTAGTCVYGLGATQIAAPASGLTATTNVIANVVSASGANLAAQLAKMPATATDWTVQLNLKSTYTGAGYPISVPCTASNCVVNYATGATLSPGQFQTFGMELIVSINRTNYQIALESTAIAPQNAGLTMTQVTNTGATTSTLNYVVTGFQGCVPTGGSVSTYNCLQPVFSLYQTDTGKTGSTGVVFIWVDMQQGPFTVSHFTNPAVASYTAKAATFGIPASFAGILVPTTAPDSGAPTVLIEQYQAIVQLQN